MNKFYNYIAPVAFFILYFALLPQVFDNLGNYSVIIFEVVGFGVPLVWLNRVANLYQNKIITRLSLVALFLLILWIIWAVWFINAWK